MKQGEAAERQFKKQILNILFLGRARLKKLEYKNRTSLLIALQLFLFCYLGLNQIYNIYFIT